MKSGIKTLLLVLTVAFTGLGPHAYAATSSGKAQAESKTTATPPTATDKSSASLPQDKNSGDKVSINTASAEELAQAMNGVGLKKAQAIVSYREEYGPFKTLDDLRQVPGMGGALVERNLSHLML